MRFDKLANLLKRLDFEMRQPTGGSSHFYFSRGPVHISIPHLRVSTLGIYVAQVVEILKKRVCWTMSESDLEYYASLPYAITIVRDKVSGGYVASISDLPGCITQADTVEEAVRMY